MKKIHREYVLKAPCSTYYRWPSLLRKFAFYDSWLYLHQNHLLIPSQIHLISWYARTLPYTWVYSIGWVLADFWDVDEVTTNISLLTGTLPITKRITSVKFGNKSRKMWALVPSQIEPGWAGSITRSLTDECCTWYIIG